MRQLQLSTKISNFLRGCFRQCVVGLGNEPVVLPHSRARLHHIQVQSTQSQQMRQQKGHRLLGCGGRRLQTLVYALHFAIEFRGTLERHHRHRRQTTPFDGSWATIKVRRTFQCLKGAVLLVRHQQSTVSGTF